MYEFQKRVVEEKEELDKKAKRLGLFMNNVQFDRLPSEERQLLRRQHRIMLEYGSILAARIKAFRHL